MVVLVHVGSVELDTELHSLTTLILSYDSIHIEIFVFKMQYDMQFKFPVTMYDANL